jgi:glycosyltransferase involved in cell wall biosynthesis
MRIAHVAVFPFHVIPGFEQHEPKAHFATWLPQLVSAFAAQERHELHWIFNTRILPPTPPIHWRNQTFHPLHVAGRLRMLTAFRADVRAVRRRLDEIQPDLVHAWGTEDHCALSAALSGRRWLLSMQGILGEYVRRVKMHPFVRLQALYERFVLSRARRLTVESRWGRVMLQPRAPHATIDLVEYGVGDLFFDLPWSPDPACPTAIFIGTPEPRKGIQEAVAAFADPRLANAELHIIGDTGNPFTQNLAATAPSNVRWLGRLSRLETAQALSRAWCLVLPTRADTSPNVVKEARVIGLPVVTTPHGGQSDDIEDGVNGFIRETGDIAGFAHALHTLLGDLETAKRMGAQRWVEQREFFRPAHTAERFLNLYDEMAR